MLSKGFAAPWAMDDNGRLSIQLLVFVSLVLRRVGERMAQRASYALGPLRKEETDAHVLSDHRG